MLDDIADRGWPLFEPGVDSDSAQAALAAAGLGGGLPLVVPTATRFAGMLEVCGLQTPARAGAHAPWRAC